MKLYRFTVCREDGSTPLGKCPVVEVEAEDWQAAHARLHQESPGFEIVSWGLASEIDAYEEKRRRGIC